MLSNKAAGNIFKYTFSFDDLLLVPKYSDIESRSEVSIHSDLGEFGFELPVISSPMDTVTEADMAVAMDHLGGLGIIHRYNTIGDQVAHVRDASLHRPPLAPLAAAAIGVTGDFEERACALYDAGARILCIDIAHGHHILMERALKTLRDTFGDKVALIAGNVAMSDGYIDLCCWGADAVRVGIGGGSICSTRLETGHGVPTIQSIFACYISKKMIMSGTIEKPPEFRPAVIIADGGLRTTGDIVKSLAAGADFAMLGSMLAGTSQSPGDVFTSKDGKKFKSYRGMASRAAQMDWRGKTSSLEGISTTVPLRGDVRGVLQEVKQNIKSGLSYSGARSIEDLRSKCEFVIQTSAGQRESFTHILSGR